MDKNNYEEKFKKKKKYKILFDQEKERLEKEWKLYDWNIKNWKEWLKIKREGYLWISWDFNCQSNGITTLEWWPEFVWWNFDCYNNNLTTLNWWPKSFLFQSLSIWVKWTLRYQ